MLPRMYLRQEPHPAAYFKNLGVCPGIQAATCELFYSPIPKHPGMILHSGRTTVTARHMTFPVNSVVKILGHAKKLLILEITFSTSPSLIRG